MTNPWTLQKEYFSIGNTTIMKRCEIIESMDAPEVEYFLRKYEEYENDVVQPKRDHSKNAYNYYRF